MNPYDSNPYATDSNPRETRSEFDANRRLSASEIIADDATLARRAARRAMHARAAIARADSPLDMFDAAMLAIVED